MKTHSTTLDTAMNRRHLFKLMGGAGAVLVAGGIAGKAGRASAQSAAQYKTTAALNFRSGAGTNYSVIAVMPLGTIVAATGNRANGFLEVGYNGTYGWAHGDYLTPFSGSDPVIIGEARTTTAVNLRTGPSTGNQVLRVVAAGTLVQISETVEYGFRYVIHNGLAGWMYNEYLSWSTDDQSGNYATTTAALNLRAEPSTSARVLTVMPEGSRVQLLHTAVGRYANVNYNGMQGWAHLDYLK